MTSEQLRQVREALGLTQTQMARKVGLHLRSYQALEDGSSRAKWAITKVVHLLNLQGNLLQHADLLDQHHDELVQMQPRFTHGVTLEQRLAELHHASADMRRTAALIDQDLEEARRTVSLPS